MTTKSTYAELHNLRSKRKHNFLIFFSLCTKCEDPTLVAELSEEILLKYHMRPYDTSEITEEEFVYDSLHNELLFTILERSAVVAPGGKDDVSVATEDGQIEMEIDLEEVRVSQEEEENNAQS